jgi:hypothetical protein
MLYLPDLPEPPLGLEPRTLALRKPCSASELRWQIRRAGESIALPLSYPGEIQSGGPDLPARRFRREPGTGELPSPLTLIVN